MVQNNYVSARKVLTYSICRAKRMTYFKMIR